MLTKATPRAMLASLDVEQMADEMARARDDLRQARDALGRADDEAEDVRTELRNREQGEDGDAAAEALLRGQDVMAGTRSREALAERLAVLDAARTTLRERITALQANESAVRDANGAVIAAAIAPAIEGVHERAGEIAAALAELIADAKAIRSACSAPKLGSAMMAAERAREVLCVTLEIPPPAAAPTADIAALIAELAPIAKLATGRG